MIFEITTLRDPLKMLYNALSEKIKTFNRMVLIYCSYISFFFECLSNNVITVLVFFISDKQEIWTISTLRNTLSS